MITYRKLSKMGRFAAQIHQYAHTRLYAELNDFLYALPYWHGCNNFENIRPYSKTEHLKALILPTRQLTDFSGSSHWEEIQWTLFGYRLPHTVFLENLYYHPEDNINFLGYFNSDFAYNLLKKYKHLIIKWFIFKKEIEDSMQALTASFRPWVAVHIRRGDFVKRGLTFPIEEQKDVLKAVRRGRRLFILSDEKETIELFKEAGPTTIINPFNHIPQNVFDFWLIKNAETVIGGGSTYAWWAAYLGKQNDYYAPPLTHLWKHHPKIKISKQEI